MITKNDMKKILVVLGVTLILVALSFSAVHSVIAPDSSIMSVSRNEVPAEALVQYDAAVAENKARETEAVTISMDMVYKGFFIIIVPIIGFFLVRLINEIKTHGDNIAKYAVQMAAFQGSCGTRHDSINRTLNRHDNELNQVKETLNDHTIEISTIKGQLK